MNFKDKFLRAKVLQDMKKTRCKVSEKSDPFKKFRPELRAMQINVGNCWHDFVVLRAPSSLDGKVAVWLIWDDKLPASYAVEMAAKERDQVLFRLGSDGEGQSFWVELSHVPIVEPGQAHLADPVLMILTPTDVGEQLDGGRQL